MEDDSPNTRAHDAIAGAVLAGPRAIVLLALAVLVPVAAGLALWEVAATHQVVPGIDGCRHVRDRTAQLGCYTDEFREVVEEQGLQRALTSVDARAADSATIGADCHVAWHPIGEADGAGDARAGRPYHNIAAATTCQQGFAHGYTIGFMSQRHPTEAQLARMVDSECGASTNLSALFNCTHAYGHVIARKNKGDVAAGVHACGLVNYGALPGAAVASPVPGERPPVLVGAEHQCLYGLFMETSMLDVDRGDRTLDNCAVATTGAARKACYAYLPSRVNAITGNLDDAARSCHDLAPAGDLRDSCIKTFSMGLQKPAECDRLVTRAEQATCRRVIDIRDNQDDLLAFADGDPNSFDANVSVSPEAGVTPPAAPAAPGAAPPSPA